MLKLSLYILSASLVLHQRASGQVTSLQDERSNLATIIDKGTHKGNINKRDASDIPVDLFRPVYAETEKPLNVAAVPTRNPTGQPKVVFNHNTFDEQSAVSGKDISNEYDNGQIDEALDENNRNQQKNNVRNFEYKIDGSNAHAPLPQDFQEALKGVSLPGSSGRNFLDIIQDRIKQQQGNSDITVRLSEDKNVKQINKTIPAGENSSRELIDTDNFFRNFGDFSNFFPLSFNPKATDLNSSNKANADDSFSQFFNLKSPFIKDTPAEEAKEIETLPPTESYPAMPQTSPWTSFRSIKKRPSNTRTRVNSDYPDYDDDESDDMQEPSAFLTPTRAYKARRRPVQSYIIDSEEDQDEDAYVGAKRQRIQRPPVRRRANVRRVYYDYEDDYEGASPTRAGNRRSSFNGYRRKARPAITDDYSDEDSYEYERRRMRPRKRSMSQSPNYRPYTQLKKPEEYLSGEEAQEEEQFQTKGLDGKPRNRASSITYNYPRSSRSILLH